MKRVSISKEEGASVLEMPQELPRDQWLNRLDLFSAQHYGWQSELELIQLGQSSRVEARNLPFEGINVDQRGADMVEITLEKEPNDRVVHIVTHVKKIIWRSPDELEVEGEDGSKTVLRCAPPPQL